ncbi:phosphoglycerate kinase [Marinilabilia salmonicolor]|jgi:phosphoglycerate kinase|uniref:Phosphoglycerate kinase n=1 Tax=Marinilabilia salmonicolor TaxID=989 RepID=A0A2T0X673_9BACT|nr:phosphoglycerate kinase [Marinilabilia salmonicolor]PRY94385.1 phosphoglycerate kinase [Marinilabilia salmonicolor]RCW30016.1 phosphoglycerate kinase [Marinilabilia salmonicolor]
MSKIEAYNFSGKKAIVRVDFNVPFNEKFEITDDTRIQAALPTLKKIIKDGGSAIVMSHLGRPKGKANPDFSMKHVQGRLSELLGVDVVFAKDSVGPDAKEKASSLQPGQVLMLENLRFHLEEEGKPKLADDASEDEKKAAKAEMKEKQQQFSKDLAALADVYVNDAFGTAHRAHASTAVIADFFDADSKMFGYLIERELLSLDKVLKAPERPFTAIMGGAKVSTKITIIENLLDKVNNLILGGGMTYTFIKAHGGNIGSSICEDEYLDLALKIEKLAKEKNVKLYLPADVLAADAFDNNANTKIVPVDEIPEGWMGLDAGPESIKTMQEVIENSKTILWNGPVGVFEMETFEKGSKAVAEAIAAGTKKGAYSLIGGGDSVACINKFEKADEVSYISTAGGALLEYLEGKELPGIKAIRG